MATRKTGGAKTSRTETVTVRLDPEQRYLAEIAARVQRRTLSSFIDWAILDSLGRVKIDEGGGDNETTVADMARKLWDVDDADRFVKLAIHAPHLLNYDEQRLWKLIKENGAVWMGWYEEGTFGEWRWHINESTIDYARLREYWDTFVTVAAGEKPAESLPTWQKTEIPF